jgi:hypothetical protein
MFVAMQVLGGAVGLGFVQLMYPAIAKDPA